MSTFLDTNVLVYAFDRSDAQKSDRAREVLAAGVSSDERYVISTQVLSEFYVVVTRKLDPPLKHSDAMAALDRFISLQVITPSGQMIIEAAAVADAHHISLWDALIVRSARAGMCDRILTEDLNDGSTITGVRIENPF